VNTTPAPLPPRRKATRGQVAAVIAAAASLLLLCCVAGAIALGGDDAPEPDQAPTSRAELPTPERTEVPVPEPTEQPEPEPEPEETEAPPPPEPVTDPRFGTCAEAIAAGYGPYTRGEDPEYGWYRDADGDGVVCER
jgi:outer membrane biosynthesis protein TonB